MHNYAVSFTIKIFRNFKKIQYTKNHKKSVYLLFSVKHFYTMCNEGYDLTQKLLHCSILLTGKEIILSKPYKRDVKIKYSAVCILYINYNFINVCVMRKMGTEFDTSVRSLSDNGWNNSILCVLCAYVVQYSFFKIAGN